MGPEMSLAETCWWTLLRTLFLCLIALPVVSINERWLRGLSDLKRRFALIALMAPFLFPELLVGYAFRNIAIATPNWAESLCSCVLFVRIVPVGVVVLIGSPPPTMNSAAIHCRQLILKSNSYSLRQWNLLFQCYWCGPIKRALPALSLMSLVAFQEFELAALFQTSSWTDWFITAQRFGLNRKEMLGNAIYPLLMQLPMLLGAMVWLIRKSSVSSDAGNGPQSSLSLLDRYLIIIYLTGSLIIGCVAPLAVIAWNFPNGLRFILQQSAEWAGLGREILIATAISICGGLASWYATNFLLDNKRSAGRWYWIRYGAFFPGLFGSLLLSLTAVSVFQQPWFRAFYDTPIPWLLALLVWLMPRALLLWFWIDEVTRTESVHLVEMMANADVFLTGHRDQSNADPKLHDQSLRIHRLLFRLRDQPRLLGMGLLCYWAYLDLSTAYLLAPSGMPSGLVRLYNFMHFGRSAAISAESMVFFGAPLIATAAAILMMRFRSRY